MIVSQEVVLRLLYSSVSGTATSLPANIDWQEVYDRYKKCYM